MNLFEVPLERVLVIEELLTPGIINYIIHSCEEETSGKFVLRKRTTLILMIIFNNYSELVYHKKFKTNFGSEKFHALFTVRVNSYTVYNCQMFI